MPRLDDLPNEVLELICGCLDHADLKRFSLTSEALRMIPRRLLFETVDIVMWKREWDRFMDFVEHGKSLHAYVRRLCFHVQSPMIDDFDEVLFFIWMQRDCPPTVMNASSGTEMSVKTLASRYYELWTRERRETQEVIRVSFSLETISKICAKFPGLGSVFLASDGLGNQKRDAVDVADRRLGTFFFEKASVYWKAQFTRYVQCGRKGSWTNRHFTSHTRYMAYDVLGPFLLAFAGQKALALKEVEIGDIYSSHPIHSHTRSSDLLKWRQVLETVEKLSLFFIESTLPPLNPADLLDRCFDGSAGPQRIAGQASSVLRELRLGWHQRLPCTEWWDVEFALCDELLTKHYPFLGSLSLCGFEVNLKDFQDFLGQHRRTLTRMCLHNMLLVFPDGELQQYRSRSYLRNADQHLKEFLVWIVQNMDFQRVEFSGILWAVQQRPVRGDQTVPEQFDMDGELCLDIEPWTEMEGVDIVGVQLGLAVATAEPRRTDNPDLDSLEYDDREARMQWIEDYLATAFIPLSLDDEG